MINNPQIDDLVGRIASEDDAVAYKQLFQLYHPRLFHFAYSITHSKETAEEIVSDVFLKIWIKRKSLIKIQNKQLYLYICTKNHAINRLIKDKKNKVFSLDECLVEIHSIYFDPEQLMITAEMVRKVHQAINQLPPKCQMIFKLVKEDGLKYKEVAELLSISPKTVENQMTIALRKMDQAIGFDIVRSVSS
jgi:RNA polymerase sigma-70 factor (family 1)